MNCCKEESRWISLSHPISADTPTYGGASNGFRATAEKSITKGDSCNTSRWNLSNHLGTHLDFPSHFVPNGRSLDDYPLDFFVFNKIGIADLGMVAGGHLLAWADLGNANLPADMDIMLIRTGFGSKRTHVEYWKENPGLSPELADDLRESFPNLRVIGLDSISISSFCHRDVGRKAHKRFLAHKRPILLLEDMDLTQAGQVDYFKCIIVAPLRVTGTDAAPCTVIAEIYDAY